MSSCFKTVSELINELPALGTYLVNAARYHAHRPPSGNSRMEPETLEEHVHLVNYYFQELVVSHGLDAVIDKLIQGLHPDITIETGNYIKKLFVDVSLYHDFGKVNECFQIYRLKNTHFTTGAGNTGLLGTSHSLLSAFIYLTRHLTEITQQPFANNPLVISCCLYFSYSIFRHHGYRFDDDSKNTIDFAALFIRSKGKENELRRFMANYLSYYRFEVPPAIINLIGNTKFTEQLLNGKPFSFDLYVLCRLNFSLLTSADYQATNEYMSRQRIATQGVLTKQRIDELYQHVSEHEWIDERKGQRNYNKDIYEKLDNYRLENPGEKNGYNLNILRTEMAVEVIRNIRLYHQHNLFYIEAPTGGGKTNLSILSVIELLKIYEGSYNKVYYVFPFTTLITQTYAAIRNLLGLDDDEITTLHSKAELKGKEDVEDGQYGEDKLNYINYLFCNYPFCLLSHIKFFDVLKTDEKETNYLLHRLANSIVVIDELQSYNPDHWDKVIYFIRKYADKFNIKFILMSATLPKLDRLQVIEDQADHFIYLLPDAKRLYFNNPNFSGRVKFDSSLLERGKITLEELADKTITASRAYTDFEFGAAKPRGSVYTIVEFIYKQTAATFYSIIEQYGFFDEVFLLSGTILDHRRKEIVSYLKNPVNRSKRIILITTQVVEAGVDIDMDIGFKDRSLIDADEQLAGRINRNVNKQHCVLYLFSYNRESVIYGRDKRWEVAHSMGIDEYKEILQRKNFDAIYNKVLAQRNILNKNEMVINLSAYEQTITHLKFSAVHKEFKLIDQQQITCFIPLKIPLVVNEEEPVFSKMELKFLESNGVYPNADNEISGEEVFGLYLRSLQNKIGFTEAKIQMLSLQRILSRYIFSIFSTPRLKNQLVHFVDVEKSQYGYEYVERWERIYSVKGGLDVRGLDDIDETRFF
ncbi:CRISPR-associated helicase Cas3' [Chitinophaga solisilvae]|uniref:CRISPR-associated helicase Cas3' n=1 Tax=Chitinophaga solisilvae TaxID=1233460 RepID=UPI001368EEF2|nr:CRISPR-associated helicase Cas3' [Chitinophaga solisilvae]